MSLNVELSIKNDVLIDACRTTKDYTIPTNPPQSKQEFTNCFYKLHDAYSIVTSVFKESITKHLSNDE